MQRSVIKRKSGQTVDSRSIVHPTRIGIRFVYTVHAVALGGRCIGSDAVSVLLFAAGGEHSSRSAGQRAECKHYPTCASGAPRIILCHHIPLHYLFICSSQIRPMSSASYRPFFCVCFTTRSCEGFDVSVLSICTRTLSGIFFV